MKQTEEYICPVSVSTSIERNKLYEINYNSPLTNAWTFFSEDSISDARSDPTIAARRGVSYLQYITLTLAFLRRRTFRFWQSSYFTISHLKFRPIRIEYPQNKYQV